MELLKWATGRFLVAAILFLFAGGVAVQAEETDQHGRSHRWKGPSTSYTLIDFSASWCVPCRKSLPRLETLAKDTPNLQVLVVSVDDEIAGRDALVEDLGLTLPVVWDGRYAIAQHHKPAGMPSTVILDPSGAEIFREEGYSEKKWRQLVDFVEHLPLASAAERPMSSQRPKPPQRAMPSPLLRPSRQPAHPSG
ncbi:MAG: TlpA family protein disulfide reductase [Deltaproteobacteria bacterium]|nr:TlpA family protein disulfide reductase [Deltaproteobacteria bacterium]